jgi:signal peptidase II
MANAVPEGCVKHLWGPCSATALFWLVAAFLADQSTKWFLVAIVDLDEALNWPVTSFFSLTMAWNRGISYSLFASHSQAVLIAASLVVCAILWGWTAAADNRLKAGGLGLIIGGALGNVFDRAWHGAVADFLHFYVGDWHWYIFNVADIAITVGVAVLIYESFTMNGQKKTA